MRSNPLRLVKIIAIGDRVVNALDKTSVDSEKFRIGAGPPALDAGTVCAFLGGIDAATKFKGREFAPVWLLQRRTAVEKLSG
ncbi:hypothetical protein [Agrobacterium tumefaciens]|uniref:hypothetical protein n=1 Tax=Agrobacterium tumefaciens TaxID=358 RepID=UPI0021FEED72|nr:hypothetical protein [Agrobacterium tumefaciens]MEA1844787.1 hypothetical protein [Agrobacterium tumefaciens]UXU09043.1 hypothetical protein FY128_26950 [Agrobacterium tumefaciens]